MREKGHFQQQRKATTVRWPSLIVVCLLSILIPWGLFLFFHPRFSFKQTSVAQLLSFADSKGESTEVMGVENSGFAVEVSSVSSSSVKPQLGPLSTVITGRGSTRFTVYGDTAVIGSSKIVPPASADLNEDSPVLGAVPTRGSLLYYVAPEHSMR